MLILKFNALSAHDLFAIERRMIRWQNRRRPRPTINLHTNVLDYGRTDLYGHLLGMFAELQVLDALDITPSQLLDFLIDVDTTYLSAPYHSFYHAVDIVTMLYFMLIELEAERYLSRLDIAALLLAALCHDAGHPGYNNLYQVNFKTDLALRYSNTSVLESYSVDITRDLLHRHKLLKNLGTGQKKKTNKTKNQRQPSVFTTTPSSCSSSAKTTTTATDSSRSEQQRFLDAVGNLILSTDMVFHYELQEQLGVLEDLLTPSTSISTSSSSSSATTSSSEEDDEYDLWATEAEGYDVYNDESKDLDVDDVSEQDKNNNNDGLLNDAHRQSLSRILLHAADISNTVRPWPISKQWSDLIVQEFFRQGDAEKAAGLEVSPGMDRDQSTQPDISLKFGDLLVQPYFQALAAFLPSARVFLDTLAENRCEWERLKDQPVATTTTTTTNTPVSTSTNIIHHHQLQLQPVERQFPGSLLPACGSNPSGRRVSVAAGTVVIPDDHLRDHVVGYSNNNKTIRKRQRSSLMLNNGGAGISGDSKHRRPLGLRSASHSGTAATTTTSPDNHHHHHYYHHQKRRIPVHWASADLLKPIVFESSSSPTSPSMLYHPHQDKKQQQQQQQQQQLLRQVV